MVAQGDVDGARRSFETIYKTNGEERHFDALLAEINNSKKLAGSTKVSLSQALWHDEQYFRASWVNIINIIWHELAGINVIMLYSNIILTDIFGEDTGEAGFTPRQGTYVVAAINLIGAMTAIWTINHFGRRVLLLWGHATIALSHFMIGISIMVNWNAGVLIGICLFLFIYQNTSGPIAYQYATETVCDSALSACLTTLYLTVLFLSLVTNPLMESKLQSQGVFFLMGILSVFAFIYLYIYFGESMGLSRAEKKALYVPGAQWGRKLKPHEVAQSPYMPHLPAKYKRV